MLEAASWMWYTDRSQQKNECGILWLQTWYKKEQELPQTSFLEIFTKMKWTWKRRLGWPGCLIPTVQLVHRDAWGNSCWRYNCAGMQKANFLCRWRCPQKWFTSVQCRGGCAICTQAHPCPEALRRWASTPPTWTRKWDFASLWETASNLMAPSLASRRNGAPPWEERDNEVISLLSVVGRNVPTPGQGCQVNGHYRTGKSRRWQLASKLQGGLACREAYVLWQQWPWPREHCTAGVAGRQQRCLTVFIWEEIIKYHSIPRSKTARKVCNTPDVKPHLASPKHWECVLEWTYVNFELF